MLGGMCFPVVVADASRSRMVLSMLVCASEVIVRVSSQVPAQPAAEDEEARAEAYVEELKRDLPARTWAQMQPLLAGTGYGSEP